MGAYLFIRGALITFSFERTRELSSCSWEVTAFIKSAVLGLKIEEEITYVRKTLQVHGCRNKKKILFSFTDSTVDEALKIKINWQ